MAFVSVFQVLSIGLFCLFLVGILNVTFTDQENHCEMTFMFEYPQFVKIKVENNDKFPQYGLYAYSEGRFTERSRKMNFDGVPVLFLPGNVGSYKQVRSLASVALRKALSSASKYPFHFDYFSVDFNDEKSALFGGVLSKQSLFTSYCLEAILKLYKVHPKSRFTAPTSVIIVGHSMGGIIAKSLLLNSTSRDNVNLIITLATPHFMPVINTDYLMNQFYTNIKEYWDVKNVNTSNIASISAFWNKKLLVNIGGGPRDLQVPSSLTISPHSDVQVLTTAIPSVWLSTDHLCIVWCKQLVLVLNRLLFSIIDPVSRQLTKDSELIRTMSKHYLLKGHPKNASYYNNQVDFVPDGEWHEDSRRVYTFDHSQGLNRTTYYMVRLTDLPDYEMVTLEAVDLFDKDWIFGCQAKYVYGQHRICMNGRHLSQYSTWNPSKAGKRRIATLNLKQIHVSYPHWTHVIVRVTSTHKPVKITVDIHSKGSRIVDVALPSLANPFRRPVLSKTIPNAIQYTLNIPGVNMLYQAYLLYLEPINECDGKSYHSSAVMSVPWATGHDIYHYFTETIKSPMRIRLSKGFITRNSSQILTINLTLDPKCVYQISIASSFYDVLGQLSRNYATSLLPYMGAILLLVLRHWAFQMHITNDTGGSFHTALCGMHVKPYYLLLSARLGIMIFSTVPLFYKLESSLKIGFTSSQNFVLLPLILYIVALGLTHLLGLVCWGLLIFSGQVAHRIILRFISPEKGRSGSKFWEWATHALGKAPGAAGMLLTAIATGSCGAVSLIAGVGFYFFLLTKMYEDYLENIVFKALKKVAKKMKFGGNKKKKKSNDTQAQGTEDNTNTNEPKTSKSGSKKRKNSKTNSAKESSGKTQDVAKTTENAESIANGNEDESNETDVVHDNPDENSVSNDNSVTANEEEFSTRSLHFHFGMFFIWCFVTLLQLPTLLTWAHNFKYSKILESDPSFIPGIIMSISATILWQIEAPKINIKYYDILEKIIYFSAVITIMITPYAPYRLSYLLPIIFALITLHQALSKSDEETLTNNDHRADEKQPTTSNQTSTRHRNIREESGLQKAKELKEKYEAE